MQQVIIDYIKVICMLGVANNYPLTTLCSSGPRDEPGGHSYQANHKCTCYKCYVTLSLP